METIPERIKVGSLIQKPKHGSKVNWVFYPGLKTSISVGVLGAVGIILVVKARKFIDFSSSVQVLDAPRFWAVPGLENLGNNCFLNVVLQALASCSSFRKYLRQMVEEHGLLSVEEADENIPLVYSLASLVEELCTVRHKRTVLSPRRLMIAMDNYITNFNLTRQQDAEEALSHLLSSLREEVSEFVPDKSSLADLPALPNDRILITKSSEEESKWQRWSRYFLKPFDGILGSILICRRCSFQISLDFQLFHSLHLSPPTNGDATIMAGCTLEDCLKQFFVAEHLENYCCSNCWHTAAMEYVSTFAEDKTDVEKLRRCNKNDSCDCKMLSSLQAFPWSNRFSHAFKQLNIARSPKILCIHLQRASYNLFGQSVKLLGHVPFPSILDLSPYMSTGVGIKSMEANLQFDPSNSGSKKLRSFPYSNYQKLLLDLSKLSYKIDSTETGSSRIEVDGEHEQNPIATQKGPCSDAPEVGFGSLNPRKSTDGHMDIKSSSRRSQRQMYRLVSVVVHYGTGKGGHYTVYRKVTALLDDEDSVALLESALEQWFCISDSEVHSVSEKEVLDADASMLFYEKIDDT